MRSGSALLSSDTLEDNSNANETSMNAESASRPEGLSMQARLLKWAHSRFSELRDLSDDWDGEGASAPDVDVLGSAHGLFEMILARVDDCPRQPLIVPSRAGGILIEWKIGNVLLDVHVVSRDYAEFAFIDRTTKKRESGKLVRYVPLSQTFIELVEGFAGKAS